MAPISTTSRRLSGRSANESWSTELLDLSTGFHQAGNHPHRWEGRVMHYYVAVANPKTSRLVRFKSDTEAEAILKEQYITESYPQYQCTRFASNPLHKTPPADFVPPRGNKKQPHWCPYCGCLRRFVSSIHPELGTRNCTGCGVSTRDYDVRVINRIPDKAKRIRKPKEKRKRDVLVVLDPKKEKAALRKARREKRKREGRSK